MSSNCEGKITRKKYTGSKKRKQRLINSRTGAGAGGSTDQAKVATMTPDLSQAAPIKMLELKASFGNAITLISVFVKGMLPSRRQAPTYACQLNYLQKSLNDHRHVERVGSRC